MTEVNFVDTTLRDGHTSLWAMGMRTDWILPIAAALESAGYEAIEVGSTPSIKKMVRELGEDPWRRIRLVREHIQHTPLRVIRGRYLAGFQMTPQSIEELWYERLAAHGARQIRMSDASNTAAVWRQHIRHAQRVGIDVVVNLIYSISPKHTDSYYAKKAREAAKLDIHGICIKDPGGLLTPERTRTLVPAILRNAKGKRVEFHTHCNTVLGPLCCLEAIKLGVRSINAAIPPLADSSSNPSVFNVARNARAMGYRTSLNEELLKPVESHFRAIAVREGLPVGAPAPYDEYHYLHQVPGGMISNLRHQLATNQLGDKLEAVLDEIARVRADLGYPIMVTPYAQFVGTQAVMNVVRGARYEVVCDEVILYALGAWGHEESSSIDQNVKDRILGAPRAKELAAWRAPEPSMQQVRQMYGGAGVSDDDLLLRYLAGTDAVEIIRAKGPSPYQPTTAPGLTRLMTELSKHRSIRYFRVQAGAASLTLQGGRVQ